MGTACPQCGNMTEVDFGMAQCGACSAVFYVDLDGSISRSEEEAKPESSVSVQKVEDWGASAADPSNPMAQFVDASSVPDTFNATDDHQIENTEHTQSGSPDEWQSPSNNMEEASWDYNNIDDDQAWNADESIESPGLQSDPTEEVQLDELSYEENNEDPISEVQAVDESQLEEEPVEEYESDDQALEPVQAKEVNNKESFLADIIDFANSDESAAREGILQYRILIQGIDTSEDKTLLREVLSDRKLLLSVEDLMDTIMDGSMEITDLNPVKASVIVAGLHNTKLKIKWSQSALNE